MGPAESTEPARGTATRIAAPCEGMTEGRRIGSALDKDVAVPCDDHVVLPVSESAARYSLLFLNLQTLAKCKRAQAIDLANDSRAPS